MVLLLPALKTGWLKCKILNLYLKIAKDKIMQNLWFVVTFKHGKYIQYNKSKIRILTCWFIFACNKRHCNRRVDSISINIQMQQVQSKHFIYWTFILELVIACLFVKTLDWLWSSNEKSLIFQEHTVYGYKANLRSRKHVNVIVSMQKRALFTRS